MQTASMLQQVKTHDALRHYTDDFSRRKMMTASFDDYMTDNERS